MHSLKLFIVAAALFMARTVAAQESVLLWTPSPNAIPCQVCVTAPGDPGGEFLACQLVDQDTENGRLGACIHIGDEGHYEGAPGEIDGVTQAPTSSYSTTIVIHPVPNVNFDCVGWTDRPADGSPGHEGVFECYPRSVPDPSLSSTSSRRRHRRK